MERGETIEIVEVRECAPAIVPPSRKKGLLLAVASILLITLFFLMPRNSRWLQDRIIPYWKDLPAQARHLDPEHRMQARFKTHYTYSKSIKEELSKQTDLGKVLLLMPSTDYFKKKGIDFPVPEPAAFYYFTGIKTVWAHNKNAAQANWYITVKGPIIQIDSVRHQRQLETVIDSLKQYDPSL